MRALVTGGAGFIGSNLVDALLERGDDVTVIDDLSTGRRDNLAQAGDADLNELDIRDFDAVSDLVGRVRPEVVFHLAAQIDVRRSVADPAFDASINVHGTINLLRASLESEVGRFVNTSTGGAIYGENEIVPAPESHPVAPKAPYGQSKFCAEGYANLFARLHDLSTVSLRYGNVYGPRQDPLGEAGVIAIYCGLALEGGNPIVFGDGLQTRDYVFAGDVVAANLAAASSDAGGSFNVGCEVQTTVLDLVNAIAPQALGGFEPQHQPERPGEVQRSTLDCSRAHEELGWKAEVPLEQGLERTLDSLRS
jgi:UDP-glucose 4-epimerase